MILKTLESTDSLTRPRKGRIRVGGNSRARHDGNEVDGSEVDDGEVRNNKVWKKGQKTSKSKNLFKSKKTESDFFKSKAKTTFIKLRQTFIRAAILHHINPERHIRVEMNASSYAISGVLSQLTLKGQWHQVAFFFCKMIPMEIRYETYNSELLAIIKAFKT